MNNNYYNAGQHNVACDVCSQKYKSGDTRRRWDGALVCVNCYEPKHPVLMPLPAVIDGRTIIDARVKKYDRSVTAPAGLSVWGSSYQGAQGMNANLTWGAWTETWDGDRDQDSFYLE